LKDKRDKDKAQGGFAYQGGCILEVPSHAIKIEITTPNTKRIERKLPQTLV
jgi:hypothetical protein